jgi:DNA-binding XRE family transcriptional regulator
MYTPTNPSIREYLQIKGNTITGYKHGYSRHPVYTKYTNMFHSCYNPDYASFKRIGANGIIVCERWHDINNFFDDILPLYHEFKETNPSIKVFYLARKDTSKGYYLENVCFATRKDINRNNIAKLTQEQVDKIIQLYAKRTYTQRELAKQFEVSLATIGNILKGKNWVQEKNYRASIYSGKRQDKQIFDLA